MSKLLRYFAPDQFCFVTSVTIERQPILIRHADVLAKAYRRTRQRADFSVIAWVILPDHFHAIVHSPDGQFDRVVQRFKLSFSLQLNSRGVKNGAVWQHRYWDHIIRSVEDLNHHIDYIHFNPVKHGLCSTPKDWRLSSYARFLQSEPYSIDWGVHQVESGAEKFGE